MAVLAALLPVGESPARAAVCLDKSMTSEEIVDAINNSPGCDRAMKLFEDCEYGTSGDVQLGAAVEKKCEADFMSRLGAPRKRAYTDELNRCDVKYQNENGTMYRSYTAFCRAEVSQRYSRQALKKAGLKAR
jgi:hypothetical protein